MDSSEIRRPTLERRGGKEGRAKSNDWDESGRVDVDAGVLLTAARALAVRLTAPPLLGPPPLTALPLPLPLPATLGAGAVEVAGAGFEAAAGREDEGGGGT